MKTPDHPHDEPAQPDDDLNELFSRLRVAPSAADPDHVAHGFETRVLARVRAESAAQGDTLRWFWRWSAVFGMAAVVCTVLVVQHYNALDDDTFVALDRGITLLDVFN